MSNGVANPSSDITNQLKSKHPTGNLPVATAGDCESLSATFEEILDQLRSFPKGTGRSGLRVSHLLEMIGENTLSFKDNFTKFVNISIAGLAPKEFAPFFMSAPLVPIIKKFLYSGRQVRISVPN